jgi:putative colanic acid biosysnthesis UDP-glucose lipid carrier transferase
MSVSGSSERTLAAEFHAAGTELPWIAFVRIALAPVFCVLSLAACLIAYREPFTSHYMALASVAFLVSLLVFRELPLVNGRPFLAPGRAIVTDWVTVIGVLLLLVFVTKVSGLYSRSVVLTWFAVTPFVLHGGQELAYRLVHKFAESGAKVRTKIIVGANEMGCELARRIGADSCRGVVKGVFDDRAIGRLAGVQCRDLLGGMKDVAEYVKRCSIDVVYIALPMSRDPRIVRLLDELRDTTASLYFVPSTLPFDMIQARVEHIGDIPAIAVCETPFCGINGVLKRASDVVIAILVLSLIWPLMAAIAAGVRRSSPGPVLFKQRRYGLDGKEILVYKFRTMTVCEDGHHIEQARKNDRRVTRFGAFLRKTSLDELPQFFNVLEGTMSVVGPRPHAVAQNEQYRRMIKGYMVRHKVRPGITGWAQINGFRGETENVEKMKRRIEYDLEYLKHWSLSLDLWIILKTALLVVKDSKAY